MSHTKGKWTVPLRTRRDGDNRCWVLRGKTAICRCFGKPKIAEANAHLIAAAPDLQYELKKSHHIITKLVILVCHYGYKDELPDVRINQRLATISKAKQGGE